MSQRYYECQNPSCNKQGTDKAEFAMVIVQKIGVVFCKPCIEELYPNVQS